MLVFDPWLVLACAVARADYKGNRPTISDCKAIRAKLAEVRKNPVSDYTDPHGLKQNQTRRSHIVPHARGACRPRASQGALLARALQEHPGA